MVLLAVVSCVLLGLGTFLMATADVFILGARFIEYMNPGLEGAPRDTLREAIITQVVKTVDSYLIASILLLFALGLYELFINRIDVAHDSGETLRLLQVKTFDDLKDRVAKLILLALITEFFQYSLKLRFTTPLELLYLALAILMIGGALYLSGLAGKKHGSAENEKGGADEKPDRA
jgi:uncharacterized membrane protein YqhA